MRDPEEMEQLRRRYEDIRAKMLLPEVQARMRADGLDPEVQIAKYDAQFAELLKTDAAETQAIEQMLHAGANVADTVRDLYRVTKKLIAETAAADPFHPQLENMRDLLEALSSEVPKEDLD